MRIMNYGCDVTNLVEAFAKVTTISGLTKDQIKSYIEGALDNAGHLDTRKMDVHLGQNSSVRASNLIAAETGARPGAPNFHNISRNVPNQPDPKVL